MAPVDEVFETIELLESILLLLPTPCLLTAARVSRTFRNTINASTKIARAMPLTPRSDANFRLPLWETSLGEFVEEGATFHGIVFRLEAGPEDIPLIAPSLEWTEGVPVILRIPAGSDTFLQRIAPKINALPISEPAIFEMMTSIKCHNCAEGEVRAGIWRASNGKYITIGDVRRWALGLRAKHRRQCTNSKRKAKMEIKFLGTCRARNIIRGGFMPA